MARAARAALADARAVEEQTLRQQMHGGAFYGAGMRVGGSATPSMGLSQFRGGGGRCSRCLRTSCCCSDSDSDGEMHGGASFSGMWTGIKNVAEELFRFGRLATTAERAAAAAKYAKYVAEQQKAVEAANAALRSGRSALTNAPGSTLALRGGPSTALETIPGNRGLPFDEALDLRGVKAPTGVSPTLASRLSAMGVTPARLAAALAAGVGVGGLAAYFASQQPPPGGNYDIYGPPGPGTVGVPGGPVGPPIPPVVKPPPPRPGPGGPGTGGPGTVDPTIDPTTGLPWGLVPGTPKKVVAAYLRSGNVPTRYLRGNQAQKMAMAQAEGAVGGRRASGRSARGQAIKEIMAKHGLSLPAASKYLKEHGSA